MFDILNGYENIDYTIVFEIKESKINKGHNFTLSRVNERRNIHGGWTKLQ